MTLLIYIFLLNLIDILKPGFINFPLWVVIGVVTWFIHLVRYEK